MDLLPKSSLKMLSCFIFFHVLLLKQILCGIRNKHVVMILQNYLTSVICDYQGHILWIYVLCQIQVLEYQPIKFHGKPFSITIF